MDLSYQGGLIDFGYRTDLGCVGCIAGVKDSLS